MIRPDMRRLTAMQQDAPSHKYGNLNTVLNELEQFIIQTLKICINNFITKLSHMAYLVRTSVSNY